MSDRCGFFQLAHSSGLFRCRLTGNPCGTDTVQVGTECPGGGECSHKAAFEAGWDAAYALNFPPLMEVVIDCGLCQNTGFLDSEKWGRVPCGPSEAARCQLTSCPWR